MGSTADLQKLLRQKDDKIAELEKQVERMRDNIDRLNGRLDMMQTVMQDPSNGGNVQGLTRRDRTTGVSAESGITRQGHRASRGYQEFSKELFKTHAKSSSSKKLIEQAIYENDFLRHLGSPCIKEIVDLVRPVEFKKDSWIIKEGDEGSEVFILEEGKVDVIKAGKSLRTMSPPTVFGELAVLYNCTRTASIRATAGCKLWAIERKVYHGLLVRMEMKRLKRIVDSLKSVPRFKAHSEEMLNQIGDIIEETHYENGQHIIRQGARGDTFYIIASGRVKEVRRQANGTEETIRTLGPGDWFGEKALEGEEVRSSNFIASNQEGVDCFVLDRQEYQTFAKRIEDGRRASKEETRRVSKVRHSTVETMCITDLNIIATLGVGGFSRVQLVQIKGDTTNRTYALKTMKKSVIKQLKQEEHVLNEKTILLESKCDFIARLYRTFKDGRYLYMLTEACLGGEVWSLLRNKGSFDDNGARFYAGCTIEALRYLHSRGVIYRDLKPENMILDNHGYMKLVDFGFAKKIKIGIKTWTFCGTPEYVAPEIIMNRGHDHSADLWSLGILIYELLTGSPPFQGSDQMQTYNAVLKGINAVQFHRQIGKLPKQLIKGLCSENPSERLGYGRSGMKDLEKQKWFESFNWDGLRQRTLKPPYPVYVKNSTDTSNFDKFPDEDDDKPPEDHSGWDKNF